MNANEIFPDATAFVADLLVERASLNTDVRDALTTAVLRDAHTFECIETADDLVSSADDLADDAVAFAYLNTLALLVRP